MTSAPSTQLIGRSKYRFHASSRIALTFLERFWRPIASRSQDGTGMTASATDDSNSRLNMTSSRLFFICATPNQLMSPGEAFNPWWDIPA
jgi:hypothetical protein